MKKLLLFTASLLLLGGTTSSAQDWKEALKKAATAAPAKATHVFGESQRPEKTPPRRPPTKPPTAS